MPFLFLMYSLTDAAVCPPTVMYAVAPICTELPQCGLVSVAARRWEDAQRQGTANAVPDSDLTPVITDSPTAVETRDVRLSAAGSPTKAVLADSAAGCWWAVGGGEGGVEVGDEVVC